MDGPLNSSQKFFFLGKRIPSRPNGLVRVVKSEMNFRNIRGLRYKTKSTKQTPTPCTTTKCKVNQLICRSNKVTEKYGRMTLQTNND